MKGRPEAFVGTHKQFWFGSALVVLRSIVGASTSSLRAGLVLNCLVGLSAQEGPDIMNAFLDRLAHGRGPAVRIHAERRSSVRLLHNGHRRSHFRLADRRADRGCRKWGDG